MMHNLQKTSNIIKYNLMARLFHWVGVLLIVFAWVSVELELGGSLNIHKTVGISFLIWTLLRLINAVIAKKPVPIPTKPWQMLLAKLTHVGLYVCMLAMPILGILTSQAFGYGVQFFGVDLPVLVQKNRDLAKTFQLLHTDVVFISLICLAGVHIVGAIYHQVVLKDNLIRRMM